MTDETKDTGVEQASRAGNGGVVPPVDTQFGGKRANTRNNKGRPKSFDALRKLAQKIAASDLPPNEKGEILTRIEATLMLMSTSRNPADRRLFLEYAFGKVKDEVDLTSDGKPIESQDNERFDRAISSLTDAIRESISSKGAGADGNLDTPK